MKLRVVVFTAGELMPADRVLYERLASDPLIDFAGIVVDEYRPRYKPFATRIVRALREDGLRWIAFKIASRLRSVRERLVVRLADTIHGPRIEEKPLSIPIHRVADIHSDESIALITSLKPDLGVIVGGRILRDSVITIPSRGTLNIHKRKLPQYRGGGPVGYWEMLAGESSIGVSIHFATRDVDAGPLVASSEIPIEECDTLDSLRLKADLRGTQIYYDAIRAIACNEAVATPQSAGEGTTYRAPSDCKVWKLQRRLERKARAASSVGRVARLRVLLQYAMLLPKLLRTRSRLTREGRAPIAIFFYHLVSNLRLNHMTLPLISFAKQIEFLRRYYEIVPLDKAVERLRTGRNDRVAASITFDDGYRDNAWAIEYLSYFGVPATFFVSSGHVLDGTAFEHDLRRGHDQALPMTTSDVRRLNESGFVVGSHAVHHEDFGTLDGARADAVLRESREQIAAITGEAPSFFAFPKGQRRTNITNETYALALKHYSCVFSAYGGYAYPQRDRRHFVRISNPADLFDLNLAMSGYAGFRDCLRGNAWGAITDTLDPTGAESLRVTLIAASPNIVGGHSVQAEALMRELTGAGQTVAWIAIDPPFPPGLRWVKRIRFVRTLLNQLLFLPRLLKIARTDVVHIFSASYWSFMLAPAPAILMARLFRKPVVLHYHSGEADDHLTRWRRVVAPLLRMVSEIVVPSTYLQRVFAAHGYKARVIPNVIDTTRFRTRDRIRLRPRLLSVRNLENYYRVDNTIRAFAELKRWFPDAMLTIAGFGSQEQELRRLAAQLRVDNVRFLGKVSQNDLPAIYDEADIFVNSSVVDNQPVSILEAFASGLPVVSTGTGDIAAMLREGAAGLLVKPDDPEGMASAVTRLVEDARLSQRVVREASQEVERYTSRHVREQWISVYNDVRRNSSWTWQS